MLTSIEEQQLRSLLVRNIDMHKRRVINAADAVDPGDYITKGQSTGVVTSVLKLAGFTTTPSGIIVPLNVDGLSGLLADPQTPLSHAVSHETQGSDEVNVSNLTGLLDEPQEALPHNFEHENDGLDPLHIDDLADPSDNTRLNASTSTHGLLPKLDGNVAHFLDGTGSFSTPAGGGGGAPSAHATTHESAGSDEIDVQNLYGMLSSIQEPIPHAEDHQADGLDPLRIDELANPWDITDLNVSASAHGLTPKSPGDDTKYLNGASTPAYAQPRDSDLSLTDITTNNLSFTKHGFAPKAPNDSTMFLDGTGVFSTPGGSGGIGVTVPGICNGRLTLAPGFPVYQPKAATPTSTNTTTDIVTWAADPGWVTGTIVTPASTLAGLTAGTRYFYGSLSSTTGAFYTSVANANANASKVDLTASVTQQIIPSGISQTSINFSPYNGSQISLYDGSSAWTTLSFVETNLALGTLTSALPYDVFAYNNSGVVALELLAWTSDTARATAIVLQNGVWVKSGATTRRLLGTLRTDSTTTTIQDLGGIASQIGGKWFVQNVYHQFSVNLIVWDGTDNYAYNLATIRQANGATGMKIEVIATLPYNDILADILAIVRTSTTSTVAMNGWGINSTTVFSGIPGSSAGQAGYGINHGRYYGPLPLGYTALNVLEDQPNATGTATWFGKRTQPDAWSQSSVKWYA